MKRISMTLSLVVCLFAAFTAHAATEGAWTANLSERRPDRMQMNMTYGDTYRSNIGMTMETAAFNGLTAAQINADEMTMVKFTLPREAGSASFEGTFRNGKGAGQFTFTPNPRYFDAVRALGVDVQHSKPHKRARAEDEQLFSYAIHDVSTDYIRSMIAEGFKVSLDKYQEMRIFDITPEYVREMRELGFGEMSARDIVDSAIHRVTPEYVRKMRAAGWGNLSLRKLQETAIHRATPEFAAEMRDLGYGNLDLDDLVSFRIHRVTGDYIRALRTLGYDDIPAGKLVEMRIHRVTPEFIRELKEAGYSGVPVDKLVAMRIHGLDPKVIRRMNDGDGR